MWFSGLNINLLQLFWSGDVQVLKYRIIHILTSYIIIIIILICTMLNKHNYTFWSIMEV